MGWILFLIVAVIGIERGVHFARNSAGAAAGAAAVIRDWVGTVAAVGGMAVLVAAGVEAP